MMKGREVGLPIRMNIIWTWTHCPVALDFEVPTKPGSESSMLTAQLLYSTALLGVNLGQIGSESVFRKPLVEWTECFDVPLHHIPTIFITETNLVNPSQFSVTPC